MTTFTLNFYTNNFHILKVVISSQDCKPCSGGKLTRVADRIDPLLLYSSPKFATEKVADIWNLITIMITHRVLLKLIPSIRLDLPEV
jgi:hypothetical protein